MEKGKNTRTEVLPGYDPMKDTSQMKKRQVWCRKSEYVPIFNGCPSFVLSVTNSSCSMARYLRSDAINFARTDSI